jgi:O-antigen/teichoic acid export membrane protein
VETPIALLATWYLTGWFGITGAAVATGLRVALDLGLLLYATVRLGHLDWPTVREARAVEATALVVALLVASVAVLGVGGGILRQASLLALATAAWGGGVWLFAIDSVERDGLAGFVAHSKALFARTHGDDGG